VRRWFALACIVALVASAAGARAENTPATFTGLYVGLDTGYGFGSAGDWCFCSFLSTATDAVGGEGGITVTGEAGYAIRFGPIVIEGAGRAGYADIKFSETCASGGTCSGEMSWLAEADINAGVIVFDDILVAATIGYAAADVRVRTGATDPTSALHDGHVLGAQIEKGMPGGWRMGLEYRRYEMQGTNETPTGDVNIEWQSQMLALAIHYELGK
jgi:hypothetical protein